jgi:hypothetical protein
MLCTMLLNAITMEVVFGVCLFVPVFSSKTLFHLLIDIQAIWAYCMWPLLSHCLLVAFWQLTSAISTTCIYFSHRQFTKDFRRGRPRIKQNSTYLTNSWHLSPIIYDRFICIVNFIYPVCIWRIQGKNILSHVPHIFQERICKLWNHT